MTESCEPDVTGRPERYPCNADRTIRPCVVIQMTKLCGADAVPEGTLRIMADSGAATIET